MRTCLLDDNGAAEGFERRAACGGYTASAIECLRTSSRLPPRVDLAGEEPGSRADFFRAIGLLTGTPSAVQGSDRHFRSTLIRMPLETWVAVFGEPEWLSAHTTRPGRQAVLVWEQPCIDGPLTCIGHLIERAAGQPWLVVTRVGAAGGGIEPL